MTKTNMDIRFEGSNLILKLAEYEPEISGKLQEFKALTFGKGTRFHKFVEGHDGTRKPLGEFIEAYIAATSTPEMRRITAIEGLLDALTVRVSKLEQALTVPPEKKVVKAYPPLTAEWYARLEAGEEKVVRMNGLLLAVGLEVLDLRTIGSYDRIKPNQLRAVRTLEWLYDNRGEDGLRTILSLITQLLDLTERTSETHLLGIDYALYGEKPLHPDAVFSRAVDVFNTPWPRLMKQLQELRQSYGFTYATLLGKLITGELKA